MLNKEKVTNVLDFPPMHFRQLATSILHFFFSSLPVLITNNNYVCENVNYISEDLFDSHTAHKYMCVSTEVLMSAGLVLACRDSQHLPFPANASYRAIPKGILFLA